MSDELPEITLERTPASLTKHGSAVFSMLVAVVSCVWIAAYKAADVDHLKSSLSAQVVKTNQLEGEVSGLRKDLSHANARLIAAETNITWLVRRLGGTPVISQPPD